MSDNINTLREQLRTIIFGTNTPMGAAFDKLLILVIIASVFAVMFDSVSGVSQRYGQALYIAEWAFTIIFTVEYLIRIWISDRPRSYIFSFYGIIDLISILPTYLSLFFAGANYLLIIRIFRVLRIFRVMKLVQYSKEAQILLIAMRNSRRKIIIFMLFVAVLAMIYGALMYLIEGAAHGFTSIPRSIYWAIVTITTVGYGDITPSTPLGQALASFVMLTGYAIIAVPTGIVTAELTALSHRVKIIECSKCHSDSHAQEANYCRNCGEKLGSAE